MAEANPNGRITHSNFRLAGLLMLWLVMENVCDAPVACHRALFSDNKPTVSCVCQMAAKWSLVAAQLMRALALCLRLKKVFSLTPLHIPGKDNSVMGIPSRSFGSVEKMAFQN